MLEAIHKETFEYVTPYFLENDPRWIGRKKETFIAPHHSISNWIYLKSLGMHIVEVIYIEPYIKEDGTKVQGHFRINENNARATSEPESEIHKKAKDTIYNLILENKLKIKSHNNKLLGEIAEIKNVRIEGCVGKKRADVLVDFDNPHPVYGRGIAFEIQLSMQNDYRTTERTFERAMEGYSICWLWDNDLDSLECGVEITTVVTAVDEYNKKQVEKYTTRFSNFFNDLELQLTEASKQSREYISNLNLSYDSEHYQLKTKLQKLQTELNSWKEFMDNNLDVKTRKIVDDVSLQVQSRVEETFKQNDIEKLISERILKEIELNLKNRVGEILQDNMVKVVNEAMSEVELPEDINILLGKRIEEKVKSFDWEEYTRKWLEVCYRCFECDKLIPIGRTCWKKGNSVCGDCFKNNKQKGEEIEDGTKRFNTL